MIPELGFYFYLKRFHVSIFPEPSAKDESIRVDQGMIFGELPPFMQACNLSCLGMAGG